MKMKWLATLVVVAAGCASGENGETLVGRVRFVDTNGQPAGDASLFQADAGIRVIANLPNLSDNDHGFHFHSVGQCTGPAFESAGPHFNPTQRQHGHQNPSGPHLGDLPNIDRGNATVNFVVQGLQMTGPNGLSDVDGAALIVHANADDQKTDPSGNSGARIRCGVVERS
jgi:superoxide dismutase, Cu-Zn family